MKKKINRKKVAMVSMILIIIIAIIAFFVIRHIKGNVAHIAPNMPIQEQQDDGMVKFENNINGINIGDRKVKKLENKPYIMIQIENNTEEDKFNIPIGIEFINSDGDVIYNTGYVVEVLLKGMSSEIYALLTSQIANMVQKQKIDHIVIKELQ